MAVGPHHRGILRRPQLTTRSQGYVMSGQQWKIGEGLMDLEHMHLTCLVCFYRVVLAGDLDPYLLM